MLDSFSTPVLALSAAVLGFFVAMGFVLRPWMRRRLGPRRRRAAFEHWAAEHEHALRDQEAVEKHPLLAGPLSVWGAGKVEVVAQWPQHLAFIYRAEIKGPEVSAIILARQISSDVTFVVRHDPRAKVPGSGDGVRHEPLGDSLHLWCPKNRKKQCLRLVGPETVAWLRAHPWWDLRFRDDGWVWLFRHGHPPRLPQEVAAYLEEGVAALSMIPTAQLKLPQP